jgi:hypothetical protein
VARSPAHTLIERHLHGQLVEALDTFRVAIVNGPRQSGKTTLLRTLHAARGGTYHTLDSDGDLASVMADPISFSREATRPVFLDEVQRGGDGLVRAIKVAVDEDQTPGSFVLSGSSRFLTIPTLSESLAGRAMLTELWPLSMAERVGATPSFIAELFTEPDALRRGRPSPYQRRDYLDLVCAGAFPEVLRTGSPRGRGNWFRSYVTTVTQRDIRDLSRIRFADALPTLLNLIAAQTAQVINVPELARQLDLDPTTVREYLPLLEMVYLVVRVPAWSRNLTAKASRAPKWHLADSGLAAHLMRRSPASLAPPGTPEAGSLFETFVVTELLKQSTVSQVEVGLYHFRDRGGAEVDCVLETTDGLVAGMEVKLAQSVNEADFRHLRMMRDRLGDRFVAGVLLYTGEHRLPFGDRLTALPAAALWDCLPLPLPVPAPG